MEYFFFLTLFLLAGAIIEETPEIQFSNLQKTYNEQYADKIEEKKRFDIFKNNIPKYGYSDIPEREHALKMLSQNKDLPESFSYFNYLGAAKNQKDCGFCFVFSFITQVEVQFSIKYGKTYRFSEQELLDCSNNELTCNGNNFGKIYSFMNKRNYLTLESNYESYTGIKNSRNCENIKPIDKFYSSTIKLSISKMNEKTIIGAKNGLKCLKALLIKNGPIGTITHYSLIKDYKGGIIMNENNCDKNANDAHAVTIIGYGHQNGLGDYWIIRNSYGSDWGENGNFRVLAGYDICGIESYAYFFKIEWDSWCGEGCDQCSYDIQNNKLNCNSCINGYGYNKDYRSCYKCIEGCKTCSYLYYCDECGEGYFQTSSNQCQKCESGCKVCKGAYDCQEWYIGNSLNDNIYLDDEIEENCLCSNTKYLTLAISLVILNLLLY